MDKIKPLVVLLTCDFKDEKLCALLKDIIDAFPTAEHEHAKQVRIVNCADIFGKIEDESPLPPQEAVKKLASIVKAPKNEHDVYIYLLHDYPVSVGQFVGLVENSKDYSILDGVIKLVSKPAGDVKRCVSLPR